MVAGWIPRPGHPDDARVLEIARSGHGPRSTGHVCQEPLHASLAKGWCKTDVLNLAYGGPEFRWKVLG